jgi:hypothetical protein
MMSNGLMKDSLDERV